MPPRNLEQPCAPGGLELLLAHHFPCADAGQDEAARREVLVDVLLARDRRDSGRGDRGVPSGALVRRAERGVRSRQNLGLGVRFLGRPAPGPRGTQGGGAAQLRNQVLGVAQTVIQGPRRLLRDRLHPVMDHVACPVWCTPSQKPSMMTAGA